MWGFSKVRYRSRCLFRYTYRNKNWNTYICTCNDDRQKNLIKIIFNIGEILKCQVYFVVLKLNEFVLFYFIIKLFI